MKGRDGKAAAPTDLLVCFPSRAHLSLMPKQICSPVRVPEAANKRYNSNNNQHLQLARASNRCGGQGSPLLLAKAKAIANKMGASEIDEPTSPKVTCAGQIKVRTKTGRGSCKNWQTVMEEIERIHKKNSSTSSSKHKNGSDTKKSTWVEALGFKKDVMHFLTCLKGFKVDFRCFGNFHGSGVISDDDEDDEDDDEDVNEDEENDEVRSELGNDHLTRSKSSRTVYSKWFMVLEENKENGLFEENKNEEKNDCPSAPPPNALLLMRCRSAPAKSWLEEKEEEEKQKQEQDQEHEDEESKDYNNNKLKVLFDEEQKKENLILKCYSPDFTMVSSDVAKETWVVGGIRDSRDPLSRSRSWKR